MGSNISEEEIAAGQAKIAAMKEKKKKLSKELQQSEFIKGTVTARSESFTSISESETQNSILAAVGKLLSAYTKGDVSMVFDVIGGEILALSETTKTGEIVIQETKGFPLMTESGFSIVFFHFYMEKMYIQKTDAKHQQIILMNVFKIITPEPPKSRYQLGGYLNATAIKDQATRNKIMDSLWEMILYELPEDEFQKFVNRAKKIDQLHKMQEGKGKKMT